MMVKRGKWGEMSDTQFMGLTSIIAGAFITVVIIVMNEVLT